MLECCWVCLYIKLVDLIYCLFEYCDNYENVLKVN